MTTTTTTTYTDLINLYAHRLTGLRDELVNVAQFPLTAARNSLIAINNAVELACNDAGKNWGPILSEGVNIKAASRALFIQRITEALEGLEGLKAALIKYSGEDAAQAKAEAPEADQVSTCFVRGSDVPEDYGIHVALPVCTDQMDSCADCQPPASHQAEKGRETLKLSPLSEQEDATSVPSTFINRTVSVLDEAGMGIHSVYVHWFRIDYGCWLDAEEVVKNGGLAEHLEWLGMREADVAELMTRDWDCQDADGLAYQCLTDHGGFDWVKLERLLEAVDAGYDTEIVEAALALGIPADEVAEAYIGEWNSDEDMARERWEQYGMLESIPEEARGYIDWELVARDMLLSGIAGRNGHYFYC